MNELDLARVVGIVGLMAVSVVVGNGELRVDFGGVVGETSGEGAGDWMRGFVRGVRGTGMAASAVEAEGYDRALRIAGAAGFSGFARDAGDVLGRLRLGGASAGTGDGECVRDCSRPAEAVGGAAGGVFAAGVGTEVPVVVSGAARGPNYERNRLNREKKKQAKESRRLASLECQELVERVRIEEARRRLAALDVEASRDARREQLAELKLERVLRDERTKAKCYDAGLDHAAEVVRLVKLASSAAEHSKRQGLATTCGWAETVASSAANSVARSSPATSLASLASVASAGALAAKKGVLNDLERELVKWNPANEAVVRAARSRVSRPLVYDDVVAAGSPFRLSDKDKRNLACVVAKMPIADDDRDYFY